MRQGSLFPDGFEILEEALDALRDVDVARAERLLRRVQAVGPDPINADIVREACAFLRSHVTAHPSVEACAAALRAVVRDVEGERLRSASADFVDEVLAGYLLRAHGAELEPPEADDRVLVGRVLLLAGRTDAAYRRLTGFLADRSMQDAAAWSALGDAAWLIEHPDAANAAYVRALVLDAAEFDVVRLRRADLRARYAALRLAHGKELARELLLPDAFCAGLLSIPPGNRWFEADEIAALLDATHPAGSGTELDRQRRFARLLFADRTAGPAHVDLARREALRELSPAWFARYLAACRAEENVSDR